MPVPNEKILNEVLSLPNNMRADLVDLLLESLNLPTQNNIDKLWAKEAEKRIKDIDLGKIKTIPGEQVINEIKEKYKI